MCACYWQSRVAMGGLSVFPPPPQNTSLQTVLYSVAAQWLSPACEAMQRKQRLGTDKEEERKGEGGVEWKREEWRHEKWRGKEIGKVEWKRKEWR